MDEYVVMNKTDLVSMADTIRDTLGSTDSIAVGDLTNKLVEAIEVGGNASGEIFGSSKYEAGSIIGNASPYIIVLKPTWFSTVSKINFIVFTVPTYSWDAPYITVMCKIQREAVTVTGYTTNDSATFSDFNPLVREWDSSSIRIDPDNANYTIQGYEYFYIIWENE